ncbi:MAG: FtsH protease activity modulator HflK [Alphaproteobacteria bacterium]|nr:FtsH protease activity modulator HflK [Alphaproteobacteria bacterium]
MPWQDNSGSNGGPTKGPWGQPPKNGDGRPGGGSRSDSPDLEELLQASRQRLKRAFPRSQGGRGGGGGRKGPELNARTIGLGGVAILGLWAVSGFYTVDAGELGVVTTFGKYTTVTSPGLNWHMPTPIQNAEVVDVESIRKIPIPAAQRGRGQGEGLMLTGDKNIVDIGMVIQYKIKSEIPTSGLPGAAQFLFNIDDPESVVRAVSESAIREVVGRNTLDFVQTDGRSQVQVDTQTLIQSALDDYSSGIEVTEVNLEKTEPPTEEVNEAFLDVEAADQDRQRSIDSARAYANEVVPRARGEAQRILEDARGYAARVTAESRGQAERFSAILGEYKKAPEVTRQRMYLETVEKVLGDMDKIIVEDGAGSGVVPYLPLNELGRNQPRQGGQQ